MVYSQWAPKGRQSANRSCLTSVIHFQMEKQGGRIHKRKHELKAWVGKSQSIPSNQICSFQMYLLQPQTTQFSSSDLCWHRSSVFDSINTIKLICMHSISLILRVRFSQSRIIHLKRFRTFSPWLSWWLTHIAIFLQYIICHFQATVWTTSQKRKWALIWPFVTEKFNPFRHHSYHHLLL